MKSGWIGNRRLQALVKSGSAILRPEVVTVADAHVKDLKSEWDDGTVSGGSVEYPDSGGVRLISTATSQIAPLADNLTNLTRLTHIPTFDCVAVEWLGPNGPDREVHNLVARLDPRRDGGQPKTVSVFRAQLFRVTRVRDGGLETGGVEVVEMSREVEVTASGEVETDFTFNFQGLDGKRYPIVGPPPIRDDGGTAYPITIIRLIALKSTGEVADNVTWLANSGSLSQTDGSTYTATVYEAQRLTSKPLEDRGGSAWKLVGGAAYPEFTLNRADYTTATVTFSGAAAVPNITGSGSLVIVARGEEPSDSSLTFQIWNGAAWVTCYDGDVIGSDNTSQGGADLSGVSTTGPWDIRVTLTPSTAADLNTPTAREFGIERRSSTFLTGVAELRGGTRHVEPLTLKGNIAAADLVIHKLGENDFRDYGSDILARNHIGQIQVRIWVADTDGSQLDRQEWMLHSVWDVDDYASTDTYHRIMLVSPLRRLKNVIIPPFVVTSGFDGTRTATQVDGTLKACYDEILDTMVALAGRLKGPGIEDATNTVAKTITRAEAKEELDRLAYLDGSAVVESQGRIRIAKMMRNGSGGDTPIAVFPHGTYDLEEIGPGYSTRTDEFFVRYNWNLAGEFFEDERRYLNATALGKLGGVGINTLQELDEETCKWLTTTTLADLVGNRVPYHFGTGLILFSVRSLEPHPELEPGDPVSVELTRFVGRSPLNDEEIRGRTSALAVVTEVGDPWGRDLTLWIPSFDKIVAAQGTVTRKKYSNFNRVLHVDTTTRTHTGDTVTTTLETVAAIPPLYQGGALYAVRCVALFGTTGAGGSKDVAIGYGAGGGAGRTVTLPSGTQIQRIDITIQAIGSNSVMVTFNHPEVPGFLNFQSSPFTVDVESSVIFTVDLANAGDSATLQMSEVTWLGEVG